MLNTEVEEYIKRRLLAGDSTTTIAQTLHSWGWRADMAVSTPVLVASPAASSKSTILPVISSIIIAAAVLSGGIIMYNSSKPTTQSIAHAELMPDTSSQIPATKPSTISQRPAVLGDSTATASTDLASNTSSVAAQVVKKSEYKIALFGDSMIDTLDSHLPMLSEKLAQKYNATFKIYNYGVGAQNVEMGLARIGEPLNYKDRKYPSLHELQPDVIIIGSFAYNPFAEADINKYWLTMAQLTESAKATGADIYFLVDIAPLKDTFGVGSMEWSSDMRVAHSQKIVDQLNSFVELSKSLNVPLIDMYTVSQANGQFGNGLFTDLKDGIHANTTGKAMIIEQIAKSVVVE